MYALNKYKRKQLKNRTIARGRRVKPRLLKPILVKPSLSFRSPIWARLGHRKKLLRQYAVPARDTCLKNNSECRDSILFSCGVSISSKTFDLFQLDRIYFIFISISPHIFHFFPIFIKSVNSNFIPKVCMISQHHPKSKEKWTQIEVENIFLLENMILSYWDIL